MKIKMLSLLLLLSPLSHGEEIKPLIFKQSIDGKELIYSVDSTLIVSVNQGCRGFTAKSLKHDVANELKLRIIGLWDITATFDGDKRKEKIDAMVGKTYVFKYKEGEVLSVKEVGETE